MTARSVSINNNILLTSLVLELFILMIPPIMSVTAAISKATQHTAIIAYAIKVRAYLIISKMLHFYNSLGLESKTTLRAQSRRPNWLYVLSHERNNNIGV